MSILRIPCAARFPAVVPAGRRAPEAVLPVAVAADPQVRAVLATPAAVRDEQQLQESQEIR